MGGAQKAKQLRAECFIVQSGSDTQIGSAEGHEPSFRKVHLGFYFIVSSQNRRIEGPAPDMDWARVYVALCLVQYGEMLLDPFIVFGPSSANPLVPRSIGPSQPPIVPANKIHSYLPPRKIAPSTSLSADANALSDPLPPIFRSTMTRHFPLSLSPPLIRYFPVLKL